MTARSDNDKRSKEERSSIAAFYAGRSVFVTGCTGFLGKVLIEKLLRSCPEIREIFLLMRPKHGLSIDDRLRKIIGLPLFEKLREERPSSFEKLIPVRGDTSVEGLGLPMIERRVIMDRVSVIFHVAANVRFDEDLKKDIFSNTRSTRDVCILAGGMKNLVALVHVSSAFAQADKPVVDEIVYPPITDWRDTIRMVECLDEQILRTLSSKYVGSMPNTYTFSKRLAEQVISDYSKDLPCVIFRPSIVISTIDDPVSGWVDNFNGPVGIMVGGGKGILRVVCLDPFVASDFLPVDVTIKAMITAAWKRGLETITKNPEVHVYNSTSYKIRRIVIRDLVEMGLRVNEKIPLEGIIWYPRTILTPSRMLHYILTLLVHLLPALLIDSALKLTGRRPMLVKIQKRVYSSVQQLSHFLHNEWSFHNSKMVDMLTKEVPPAEKEIFGFDFYNFNTERYFENCLIGAKRYLLHEDLTRIKEIKHGYERMRWIDRIFNVCMIGLIAWILWRIGVFSSVFTNEMFFDN
ncbi:PREDICTED: putative fatty acyl-CoA reductase CG5065 [Dufourea novaeangliae]|uniref:putative fatty acyl-CoA reductase CG5065 n=1 Tax=Dufourea novaeangliae TaxID=178035 RepID=UPI000767DB54|nr:PREDICTED: putative fatty acyl-CoA reductase CG5065 [Dufourea novaeangliae]